MSAMFGFSALIVSVISHISHISFKSYLRALFWQSEIEADILQKFIFLLVFNPHFHVAVEEIILLLGFDH